MTGAEELLLGRRLAAIDIFEVDCPNQQLVQKRTACLVALHDVRDPDRVRAGKCKRLFHFASPFVASAVLFAPMGKWYHNYQL